MSSQSSQQPLVLEYKKRRFDGGPEIEQIEQIEYQYRLYEQQRLAAAWHAPSYMGNPMAAPVPAYGYPQQERPQAPPLPPQPRAAEKVPMKVKMYKVFVMPCVELVLGLSGMLIGSIMMASMMKGASANPDVLQQERKALIDHSWTVVRASLGNIVKSPLVALRVCLLPA